MDMIERDPAGIDAKAAGAKLDAGKAPVRRGLLEYFPRACLAVAAVSAAGAAKYSWGGWQTVPQGVDRYGDAEVRHICKAAIGGPVDPDSGLLHKAHEAWNAMAALELELRAAEAEPAVNVPFASPLATAVERHADWRTPADPELELCKGGNKWVCEIGEPPCGNRCELSPKPAEPGRCHHHRMTAECYECKPAEPPMCVCAVGHCTRQALGETFMEASPVLCRRRVPKTIRTLASHPDAP